MSKKSQFPIDSLRYSMAHTKNKGHFQFTNTYYQNLHVCNSLMQRNQISLIFEAKRAHHFWTLSDKNGQCGTIGKSFEVPTLKGGIDLYHSSR